MDILAALVVTVLFGSIFFGGIVLIRRHYGRGQHHKQPACARCGYPVRGLRSWECPECGADLQQVGTTSPRRGRPPSLLVAHGWTLLFTWWARCFSCCCYGW